MSGHWPPEWEDPDEEFPAEADQEDATVLTPGGEARLSEVAAFLASVPAPALPDAFEARISAALAAEAAARTAHPAPADDDGILRPAPRARRYRGGDGPRRRFQVRLQVVGGSLVTCLLLVVLGFALSHAGSSSSSSSAAAGSAAAPAEAPGPARSSAAGGAGSASSAAGPESSSASAPEPAAAGTASSFVVTVSGTKYQQATLAGQVRSQLAASGGQETFGQSVPSPQPTVPAASATAVPTAMVPSPALRACVLQLTHRVLPRLVDRASYAGKPAYVIATSSYVWVVEPGCTAANPELITSVPLAGLPGNLRALISVEQQAFQGGACSDRRT